MASHAVLEPPVATLPAVAPPASPPSTPKLDSAPKPKSRPVINPWVIALTVTLATFMELLDTSIANVSL
ncbi:MAG TPA: hypothetical protein VGG81_06495, partial [Edaphobacter sp.]